MMYQDFIKDFVKRTQENYKSLSGGPYEVTQLINSSVGLLIIPKENFYSHIDDNLISSELLNKLKKCIVYRQGVKHYEENYDLKHIVNHIRNSIAHGSIDFRAEQNCQTGETTCIHSVIFTDTDKKYNPTFPHFFEIEISIPLLREFFFSFANAVSNLK